MSKSKHKTDQTPSLLKNTLTLAYPLKPRVNETIEDIGPCLLPLLLILLFIIFGLEHFSCNYLLFKSLFIARHMCIYLFKILVVLSMLEVTYTEVGLDT